MNRVTLTSLRRKALFLLIALLSLSLLGCNGQGSESQEESRTVSLESSLPSQSVTASQESNRSLADFEGWWHVVSSAQESLIFIDAQAETYTHTDKYGNAQENVAIPSYTDAYYDSDDDRLVLEGMFEDSYLYFKDDDMDTLYYEAYDDDEELPAYVRAEEPRLPALSLDGLEGKWYRVGNSADDESYIMELLEDGSYRCFDSDGEKDSGNFVLTLRSDSFYHGYAYDYLSLSIDGNYSYAYISDDRRLMVAHYVVEDERSYTGYDYASDIYLHESCLSTLEGNDALQRYRLYEGSWVSGDEANSLRFSLDEQIHNYSAFEYGWTPDKGGTWEYSDGMLTIAWDSEYIDGDFIALENSVTESCPVDDVREGFTLPSLGHIVWEAYDE